MADLSSFAETTYQGTVVAPTEVGAYPDDSPQRLEKLDVSTVRQRESEDDTPPPLDQSPTPQLNPEPIELRHVDGPLMANLKPGPNLHSSITGIENSAGQRWSDVPVLLRLRMKRILRMLCVDFIETYRGFKCCYAPGSNSGQRILRDLVTTLMLRLDNPSDGTIFKIIVVEVPVVLVDGVQFKHVRGDISEYQAIVETIHRGVGFTINTYLLKLGDAIQAQNKWRFACSV